MNATAVAGYIALAGLWGAPVSGASMNTARSLGPALVLGDTEAWWAYLAGPVLRRGDRRRDRVHPARKRRRVLREKAAEGGLGWLWKPGPSAGALPARRTRREARPTGPLGPEARVGAAHPHCAATSGPRRAEALTFGLAHPCACVPVGLFAVLGEIETFALLRLGHAQPDRASMTLRIPNVTTAAYKPVAAQATACSPSCRGLPKSAPSAPPALSAFSAKTPVRARRPTRRRRGPRRRRASRRSRCGSSGARRHSR